MTDVENELRILRQKLESLEQKNRALEVENKVLYKKLDETAKLLDQVVEKRSAELNEEEEYVADPKFRDPAVA